MMGSGKTIVGRALAARLGCRYLDSDEQVEARTGRTVAQIFAADGEPAFRRQETSALGDALAVDEPVVVSVAGGAVLAACNRDRLRRDATVVWLRARPATLAARVGDGTGRPLLAHDSAGTLAALDRVRRPLYAEVADVAVDVDALWPRDVVEAIVARLVRLRAGTQWQ